MLSVVIPIYNAAQTLDRCVESVARQSGVVLEIILVDDGSRDASPRLCDEWGRRDGRVKVIHQPNGGLSAARNAGIEVAKGELLTFVDADDYVAPDTYRAAVDAMTDRADIVEYPVRRTLPDGRIHHRTFIYKEYTDPRHYWTDTCAYEHCYAWNKVYRRHLFDTVRFPLGAVFEDIQTIPRLLRHARAIRTIGDGLYHYTYTPTGITARAGGPELQQLLRAHLALADLFPASSASPLSTGRGEHRGEARYYLHLLNIQLDVCRLLRVPPELPLRPIRSFRGLTLPQKAKALFYNLFGFRALCTLSCLLHRH